MSIDAILNSKPKKSLSVNTVNKYLDFASGLFKYAKRHNYIRHNPFEGLRVRLKKRAGDNRAPFNEKDLKTLFHSADYLKDKHKHSYCFWLPVLALYTGCRLEELCQLHTDDVKQMGDLWVLDINDDTQDKKLKTLSSKRIIPLHPHLTDELCFPKFVEKLRQAGEQRLFPELNKIKDRYGHAAGRWFGRYKSRLGIVPDEKGRSREGMFKKPRKKIVVLNWTGLSSLLFSSKTPFAKKLQRFVNNYIFFDMFLYLNPYFDDNCDEDCKKEYKSIIEDLKANFGGLGEISDLFYK